MEGYQREIDAEPYAALEAAIITLGELPILVCGLGALFPFSVRTPSLSRTSMSFSSRPAPGAVTSISLSV
ncbi:hypothetical protein EV561_14918 [Rhizobium sp. BK376]|nr:hypothetical protein EV561_14918 [Rhizobium sp. BK376]